MNAITPPAGERLLGLFLVPGFSLLSYAAVIDPFRAANLLAGRPLYRWHHLSVDGGPAVASSGALVMADGKLADAAGIETLFVFAGGDPARFTDRGSLAALRRLARGGVRMAGVSGGPFILARAGLLDGRRATIHWDHRAAFADRFPTVRLESGLFVTDGPRLTCAGGTAGLDLAIDLIAREQGAALAAQVSDWFIRTHPRAADRPQRLSWRDRTGITNGPVLTALAAMETHIEQPLSAPAIAARAGVSLRQLQRLFTAHVKAGLAETYLRLRLDHGRDLLRRTSQPVMAVALACGFESAAHFTNVYRRQFGRPPGRDRNE